MNIRIVCSFFVLLGCSQAIHVQGQETDPGFINIDCGAASDYYDDNVQLHHATDDKYVDSGTNMQPQLQLLSRLGDNNQQLRNLRSFPNGKRNCYTLKPTNAKNTTFLIRASFYYGNYDGKNQTPVFDLHIGVNYWTTVNSTYNHYEIEYTSLNDNIQVCLINTGNGIPFISELQLRMLDNSIYRLRDASLILVWRFNVGSSLYYRHPSDPFDRIWEPKIYDHLVSVKSNANNLVDNNEYRVPGEVLMNAQKAVDSSSLILSGSLTDVQRWYILFHFTEVEILPNNTKREFNIYVNNEPALTNPIRLEYLKPLTVASPIVTGLWINVSINPTDNTNPYPPILNAIEYFTVLEHRDVSTFINDVNARHVIIIVTASVGSMVLLFIAVAIICKIRRSKTGQAKTGQGATGQGEKMIKFRTQRFSYSEVLNITDNLTTVIGEGGFGKVYHGKHDGMEVAVKLLSESSKQGSKEFQAEAELLMGLSHRNLVSLVGFCDEDEKMVLIYEFMTNGDLKQHLSSERGPNVLSWTQRVRIALDIAQGLHYLHNGCMKPIIHRDLKPANILLNGSMEAKIADFGLSKAFKNEHDTHITTSNFAGTYGYMDPEFHAPGGLKKESDIYSFGIILFELVTGYHPFRSGPDRNSVGWVFPFIENGDIQSIVDNRLNGDFNINTARKVAEIAVTCVEQRLIQRPDISSILDELKECWEIEVSAAGNNENKLIEPSNMAASGGVLEDDVPSPT